MRVLLCLLIIVQPAWAQDGAQQLRQTYDRLASQLDSSAFGRPLHLESMDSPAGVQGIVYARLDQSFDTLKDALSRPENWCEIFILHINTKYCGLQSGQGRTQVLVKLGSKDYQELSRAHLVKFDFRVQSTNADFFEARMEAPKGPLGTTDYRVALSAIALGPGKSFITLRYSYVYSRLGSMAMDAYLGTRGRDKVGFSRIAPDQDGKPQYVKGYRGVVERNAMRYYLAIDAFLSTLKQAPSMRQEQALARWFDGTEQYATQLHEVDRKDYLDMKRREIARARNTPPDMLE